MKVYSVSVSYPWDLPPRSFTCSTSDRSSLQTRCKKQTSGHLEVFTQLTCHFDFEFAASTKFHANSQLMDVGSLDSWLRIYAWHWFSFKTNWKMNEHNVATTQVCPNSALETIPNFRAVQLRHVGSIQKFPNPIQLLTSVQMPGDKTRIAPPGKNKILSRPHQWYLPRLGLPTAWIFASQSKSTKFRAEKSARKCGSRNCGSVQTNELQFSKRAYLCTVNVKTLVANVCNHIIKELFKKGFILAQAEHRWKPHDSTIHSK